MPLPDSADYVVIGTGSAGAVLANRLSARPDHTVVALEAGPKDSNKFIHIPAAFPKLFRSAVDWDYLTEPQPALNGRRIYWPRGKMLGGSSSMNAMMWIRGFAADYDEWAVHAGEDWSFTNVAKYFARIENMQDLPRAGGGAPGPLSIATQRNPRSATSAFLEAAQQCGYTIEEPNLPQPEGFSQTLVTQDRGARCSTADAYLKPVLKRRNLTVLTEAHVTKILFDGTRAVGVEYEKGGVTHVIHCRREVVLCGGAINTPQLLMLSGVGDRHHLGKHGIPVVTHSPHVGQNLADHLASMIGYNVESDTLFAAERPWELVNYLLRRRGMLTSNVGEAYGFVRSRPDLQLPDLELIFGPAPFFNEGLGVPSGHAIVLGSILVKPLSRGAITLASSDARAKPIIDPRYLSDPAGTDREAIMAGLRICAKIASAPALDKITRSIAHPPRTTCPADENTLVEALNQYSHTLYHPVGTCRMGTDVSSVVTPDLRVRGTDSLRVADASVMPTIIRGHTHAPSVVIGERAADLITDG